MQRRFFLIGFLFLCLFQFYLKFSIASTNILSFQGEWQKTKGKHFIIYHPKDMDSWKSRQILNKAEKYYVSIANQIGYVRYDQYWTWKDRVKIFIFNDKAQFVKETGLPDWSLGGAVRDEKTFESKAILTYRQEEDFLDGVLPHEISHLMLRDYFAPQPVPMWFDEGIAQLNEEHKSAWSKRVLPKILEEGYAFSLQKLFDTQVGRNSKPEEVLPFYAQSISVIDFLIKRFGKGQFSIFTQKLKLTGSCAAALKAAYSYASMDSVELLEKKWLRYINK